jgi:hypothetical protein
MVKVLMPAAARALRRRLSWALRLLTRVDCDMALDLCNNNTRNWHYSSTKQETKQGRVGFVIRGQFDVEVEFIDLPNGV